MKNAFAFLVTLFLSFVEAWGACSQEITLDPSCTNLRSLNISQIKELITQLGDVQGKADNYDLGRVYSVLAPLNQLVKSQDDIQAFRCQDDLATIRKIIAFARIDERVTRINASLLLANVVDNTTLCGVLEELFDHSLNDNARYNLWQVVLVVARYARVENQKWIKATVSDNQTFIGSQPNYGRTLEKIDEVNTALTVNQRTDSLKNGYEPQYRECLTLPHIATMADQPPG
ncbi:exported hypothetical protein [Mesorhizobium sp. ORS 3324]|nr:exported hypothetical protein [Mesorhizobium sp. ORS 3324]